MSGHQSLADSVLVSQDVSAQIASANVTGSNIDMQGWDGCMFVFNLGVMASGATFTATVYGSPNANMTGSVVLNQNVASTVTNANLSAITNASNTNIWILDVYNPGQRYIQEIAQPGTANTTFSVEAVRYRRGGVLPPTQSALAVTRIRCN